MPCLDVRIKYRIELILGLNIYSMFGKFSWIGLRQTKFEFNPKIRGEHGLVWVGF